MKKIFILFFMSLLFVSGCSSTNDTNNNDTNNSDNNNENNQDSQKEPDVIEFSISDNIVVLLDEIEKYNWKQDISITKNGLYASVDNATIEEKNNNKITKCGVYDMVVTYATAKKEFKITVANAIVNAMNYDGKLYTVPVLDGACDLSAINTVVADKKFEGWYSDLMYENKVTDFTTMNGNVKLYGKWVSTKTYSYTAPAKEEISTTMNSFIDSLIEATPSYIPAWNMEGFKGRWNYIDGVFLNSIVELYNQTNDAKYKDFLVRYVNYYIDEFGSFVNPQTGESGYRTGELDSICESKILFDLSKMTRDDRYNYAIDNTYYDLIRSHRTLNGVNFSHKSSYANQIWLDGMYMYGPFYARYADKWYNYEIFMELYNQYKYINENMKDNETGLFYHAHDTSKEIFWANKTTGNSPSFWLRSMGWFLVSLVDVLEYYPESGQKEYLKTMLKDGLDSILKYKDANANMFYQLIDKGAVSYYVDSYYTSWLYNSKYMVNGEYVDTYIDNYLESSGSSMIAYAILKASRMGYIPAEYNEIGSQIFEGVYAHSFKDNKLNDICITSGLGPDNKTYRDGSVSYYLAEPVGSNDAKGVGPFIMAYLEYIK